MRPLLVYLRARAGRWLAALVVSWLLAAPMLVHAGAPFLTDDPFTAEAGQFQLMIAAQYTHRDGDTSGNVASAQVNYGFSDNFELHGVLPYAFDHTPEGGTYLGLGDIELGTKFRFLDDEGWHPALGIAPAILFPSGSASRGLGTGRAHGLIPLWAAKELEPWTIFGGGGYAINPGPDNSDYWFAGLGAVRQITSRFALGGEVFHNSRVSVDGKSSTAVNLGAVYDVAERHHLLVSVGTNIRHAATNNRLSSFLGWQADF